MRIRYFTLLLFFLCFNCKKDDEVDPRNPYVDTYNLTINSTLTVSNVSTSVYSTYDDFLIVSKDEQPRALRLIFSQKVLKATLNESGEFDIPAQVTKVYSPNTFTGQDQLFEGKGVFTSKGVDMTLTRNESFPAAQVKEVLKIKGPKKL
jgi:hypothetical protein